MPSSPYIEVSQETRARIAEIRRRASAAEGRQVRNDEIVARLIDAAERERLARVAYEAIRHQYQEVMKDLDGAMPIDHFVAQRNYAVGLQEALNLLEDLTYEAVGTEECLNPSEYEVPAEIVERANQILADSEEEF